MEESPLRCGVSSEAWGCSHSTAMGHKGLSLVLPQGETLVCFLKVFIVIIIDFLEYSFFNFLVFVCFFFFCLLISFLPFYHP